VKASEISFDLIKKYSQPGPRYTSYPPANYFTELDDYSALIAAGRDNPNPISLYFHLPFCETLCWFCGCHTITTKDRSLADDYIDLLEQEIDLSREQLGSQNKVTQLHFGGGTPNFLTASQLDRLSSIIHDNYTFTNDAELSVELDPRRLNREQIDSFARMGVNRASFGVQDCDTTVQRAIHRTQPEAMNVETMQLLRDYNFKSVNVDLIYGLPKQTCDSFEKTIDHVVSLKPNRIALFNYAHVPWMRPAQKLLERVGLPSAEQKIELFHMSIDQLTACGYVYIGMDHFALPDDELVIAQQEKTLQRNFQGYSTHANSDIRAFGISSISSNQAGYYQNEKNMTQYRQSLANKKLPLCKGYQLTQDDRIRGTVISRLMCDLAINFSELSLATGTDLKAYLGDDMKKLQPLIDDGLLSKNSDGLKVSPTGRFFIRNIAMCFDNSLEAAREKLRFSNTV